MSDQLVKLPEGTKLRVGSHDVKIVKYLSEGGFAHIYQVLIDPKEYDSEIACLKRVIVPDKAGLDQLRKEVDVMKKLKHARSIVRYYDSHAERLESGSYQVLVLMELCPNKSLLDFMNAKIKTKLSESEILKIMFDISIGLFEMHKMKMIHRDIKIENVLIDAHHRFKICDFGSTSIPISPPKNQQEFQTLSHDIMYQTTPQYRSPEMIDLYRGFPIDEKVDIWALGCFLYKLCFYTTPFEANGDIAILHASFQFPSHPQYSGDLMNLIIILLQENPLFRPNIVQVIKLVCKMLKVDFNTLSVDDIYKTGSYNFHALHEYQQQKQNEMLRQQQMYFQQQQLQLQQQLPPQIPNQSANQQPQQPQIVSSKSGGSDIPTHKSSLEVDLDGINDKLGLKDSETHGDSDSSIGEIEDLDNVEERYPSLENIVADSETSKSAAASIKSTVDTSSTYPTVPPEKKTSTSVYSQSPQTPKQQQQPQVQQQSYSQFNPIIPDVQHPTQPQVLGPQELQKLNHEQLQQYNYQHQAYHYQMNQWMYYQQQLQQQQQPSSKPIPQNNVQQLPNSNSQVKLDKSSSVSDLKNKEAWETKQSKVDEDAGKLADDIFGSKSRSPTDVQKAQKPQKTSQSIKSEPALDDSKDVDDDNELFEFENEGHGKNIRLTKSNNSSKADLINKNQDTATTYNNNSTNNTNNILDGLNIINMDSDNLAPSELELFNPEVPKEEVGQSTPVRIPSQAQTPQQSSTPAQVLSVERPKTLMESKVDPRILSSPVVPLVSRIHNPFPIVSGGGPSINESISSTSQPDSNKPILLEETKTAEPMKKSSSNPWGEYRNASNITNNNVNTEYLHKKMNSLNLGDDLSRSASRKPSYEEPNLIDLEVGLESSSSTSTPVMAPEQFGSQPDSLIDLELDGKFARQQADRPHFKKKVSAIPNPSDFKVQEEVIDWASDDESPANSSKMNRLSIRNSLKKQPRKSNETKRSESASGENRKRYSRIISKD